MVIVFCRCMAGSKKQNVLRIILIAILTIMAGAGGYLVWLSYHYKHIMMRRLPEMVASGSDSVYHISFADISVNIFKRRITITDLKLWPDLEQVKALKEQHRHTPPTLSTVEIASLEVWGIAWGDLVSKRSLDCDKAVVHDLKWKMICKPNQPDSTIIHDKETTPYIGRTTVKSVSFLKPDITYEYRGKSEHFTCNMKGGTATLNSFVYNADLTKDTSVFLYARSGKVRFDSFLFQKPSGHYSVVAPDLDFETTPNTVTLELVKIKHMVNHDPVTGKEKENYNLGFPVIELEGFNWNRLITNGVLRIPVVTASAPTIEIRYLRENATNGGRKGSYPNQLLLEVGLKTNIEELNIKKGHFKYTEVTKKGDEGVILFTGISGRFSNITNIPKLIARNKLCRANLEGNFMGKSHVVANFELGLADNSGRFKMEGIVKNLEGNDISQQAQVFTFVKATSFHLSHMDMHIEGDETYAKGNFKVLYENLKISLFKFNSNEREGKHGLFAFAGSALVLYPSNPMPGKDIRTASTSFARDTTLGFISVLWQSMYRAVKKTAVREQSIVTISDGPETGKGEQPKKGFFKRLFGKKK